MKLKVIRYANSATDTLGALYVNNKFFAYTLEDEYRETKILNETRIPEGIYKVGWQEINTPLTIKYKKRYKWFNKFIHVKDVPNFIGIYIHPGNTERDTGGCLLIGDTQSSNADGYGSIGKSLNATRRLYSLLEPILDKGEDITIEYIDLFNIYLIKDKELNC